METFQSVGSSKQSSQVQEKTFWYGVQKKKKEDSKVEFFVIRRCKFYWWVSIFVHLPCGIEKKSARKLVNAITCDKVKGKSCVRPAILFKAAVAISLGARQTAAIPVPMRIALSPSSSPLGSRQMSRSANSPRENRCASPDNDGDKRLLKRPKGEMRVRNNIYTRLDGLCHQSINRLFFQQLLS